MIERNTQDVGSKAETIIFSTNLSQEDKHGIKREMQETGEKISPSLKQLCTRSVPAPRTPVHSPHTSAEYKTIVFNIFNHSLGQ